MNQLYNTIPSDEIIKRTAEALRKRNIEVDIVDTKEEALERTLNLIPKGSEVFTSTSETLNQTGLLEALNNSGDYESVRNILNNNPSKEDKRRLGAAPEYVVGSIHAISQDGRVLIASSTGSQLPSYASGADNVIWVVGAQKITKDLDDSYKRLEQHVFPLEDARALKAYGFGSGINKVMIVNHEYTPNRVRVIFVKEVLGF